MTLIEAIRKRMPDCDDVTGDELLKSTEGSLLREAAELDVACTEFARVTAIEWRRAGEMIRNAFAKVR